MKSKIYKATARALSLLVCASAILLFVQAVSAQETRGTIRGTVTDPNGSAVPGAAVKVIDPSRGNTATLTTNDDGLYQANYLIPGTYRVEVEFGGFKRYVRENVVLQIAQTVEVNVPLEVGGTAETVTVSVEAPPLETESGNLGLTVDAKRIAELPLVHGDPYTLIGLTPGVAQTGSQRLDRPFEPTHIVGYAVDGTRGNRSDLTIDGAPSTATANANEVIATYVPPTDIIAEFKVQTATFDAQFGNTEGGVTSISIKSGTNNFHGAAYYFAEPGTLAANDFFGNARGNPRPETKSDRFGFSVNGPVQIPYLFNGKDKTFFLFGYEGIRDSRPRFDATNIYTPTAALRNGDFSGLGVTIFDPLSAVLGTGTGAGGNGCAVNTYCRTAFAGNVIPTSRISPIARSVLNYYAQPKAAGLVGNINDSTLTETTQPYDNFTFRIDQNISDKNHLFVRGSWYNRDSLYNDYLASDASGVNFIFKSRQGVIDDVHTFDSTTFLNVRYGYNRFIREQDQAGGAIGFDLTQLGFSSGYNSLLPDDIRRFPRFDFPSPGVLGTGFGNEFRPVDTHSGSAILNKIINSHALKFGGELRVYREDSTFTSNDQTGQFIFDNTYTRASTAASTDTNGLQAFAAFLLGLPSTQQIVRRADYSEYSKTYGFFAHDDWRVNSKLTLNMGLRYEVETPLRERNNKSVSGFDFGYTQPLQAAARARLAANPVLGYNGANINPAAFNTTGGLLFAGVDTGEDLYNAPKNSFLPRFGAAYQLDEKTVLRGGFGLFAGFLGERRGDVIQPGFTRTTSLATTSLANGAIIPQSIANFPNITVLEPVGNAQGRQTGLGTSISFFNQNPKVSKQARIQIGIQRDLGAGFIGEAVYVGNYGYDIEITQNINALPNIYLNTDSSRTAAANANNTFLTQAVANPFFGLPEFAGTAFANSTIARSQLLRPFPAFGDITTTNNDGKSWYQSGQFSLNKRFTRGYSMSASYTWSKWIQATEYLNPGDARPTRMISDQDTPHRLSLSGLYALPFGRGQLFFSEANGVVDRIVNGFQLQGVYNFQVGFPIAFGSFNATTGATAGNLFYRGGAVAIASSDRTTSQFFNTSPFASAADFPSFLPTGVTPTTATAAQIATAIGAANTAATPVSQLRTLPYRFANVRRDNVNQFDFSILKDTRIREGMRIQLRFELINAFNEPYFPVPVVNPTQTLTVNGVQTPAFGTILSSSANLDNYARRAQVGIKFLF